jgi:hypothetical protein
VPDHSFFDSCSGRKEEVSGVGKEGRSQEVVDPGS